MYGAGDGSVLQVEFIVHKIFVLPGRPGAPGSVNQVKFSNSVLQGLQHDPLDQGLVFLFGGPQIIPGYGVALDGSFKILRLLKPTEYLRIDPDDEASLGRG